MNVLNITRRFYPFIGGVENYIYETAKRLNKRGINCRVLTLDYDILQSKNKVSKHEIIDGIEVFRIPGFGYYKKPIPLQIPLYLYKWADIIHIHDLRILYETSLLLKFILRYKIVISTHGFLFHTQDLKLLKSLLIPLYYKPTILNFIDSVICVSKQDYEYFIKWNLKNIHLIRNGINYNRFNQIERQPKRGELLYFGRLDKNKGLDLLFESLSLIKNYEWRLNIAGSGQIELVNELKLLADKLGLSSRIRWHGFVNEDKLYDLLSLSYICFFPSTYEGFGLTLIEAMACGSICIANRIPTYQDIIQHKKDGFIVNFKDKQTTAEIISCILNSPTDDLLPISKNAKESAIKYDWEAKIEDIIKVYRSLK